MNHTNMDNCFEHGGNLVEAIQHASLTLCWTLGNISKEVCIFMDAMIKYIILVFVFLSVF